MHEDNIKENLKSGFTLVELIVVLVILAILSALLIPALTGYIDKAQDKQLLLEARAVLEAAQTIASEEYADKKTVEEIKNAIQSKALNLAEVNGTIEKTISIQNGKINAMSYRNYGKQIQYSYVDGKVIWGKIK